MKAKQTALKSISSVVLPDSDATDQQSTYESTKEAHER
jgi:hypothetical protein